MRRVVLAVYMSVDGIIDLDEDQGWTAPYWNDELEAYQREQLFASDALLLGRKTYDGFAASWPERVDEGDGFTDRINSLPKYVASHTLTEPEWNAQVLEGDVAEAVTELKRQPGRDILVYGGGELVDTLIAHDLIDEYRIMVHPVALGHGRRLFPEFADARALTLVASAMSRTGVAMLTYTPAADEPAGA